MMYNNLECIWHIVLGKMSSVSCEITYQCVITDTEVMIRYRRTPTSNYRESLLIAFIYVIFSITTIKISTFVYLIAVTPQPTASTSFDFFVCLSVTNYWPRGFTFQLGIRCVNSVWRVTIIWSSLWHVWRWVNDNSISRTLIIEFTH